MRDYDMKKKGGGAVILPTSMLHPWIPIIVLPLVGFGAYIASKALPINIKIKSMFINTLWEKIGWHLQNNLIQWIPQIKLFLLQILDFPWIFSVAPKFTENDNLINVILDESRGISSDGLNIFDKFLKMGPEFIHRFTKLTHTKQFFLPFPALTKHSMT